MTDGFDFELELKALNFVINHSMGLCLCHKNFRFFAINLFTIYYKLIKY
jgi:hypothetical protein